MPSNPRAYDIIGFGDEVPGVLALICAAREYRRRTAKYPRVLLMSKGSKYEGVGGHLVRGGLAYLDRSQITSELRASLNLDLFGAPPAIYKEFLQRAGVTSIALDPRQADAALRKMMQEAGVALIREVEIKSVLKDGTRIVGIEIARGETYWGQQFIDSTVNAELAQAAGVNKLKGFETFGLPESELPVTLVFETQGITPRSLYQTELIYLQRFTNLADAQAQEYLMHAAGFDRQLAERLRKDMVDTKGHLKRMWIGADHIDICAPALSAAYHSFRGKKLSLHESGVILDKGNIAILPGGRLSWNAALFAVTGSEAEALARRSAKPTPKMLEEMGLIAKWMQSIGATAVTPALELYIRHAGNVTGVVEPLSGAMMLRGGVPPQVALGTFSYHFDVRGGIPGIGLRAIEKGFSSVSFHDPPIFNIGIRHAVLKNVPNLAVVSPASGFEGYASAAGRIVEFNVAVGQGLGIAAIIALLSGRNLADITDLEIRNVLVETGQLPRIFGIAKVDAASRLYAFESSIGVAIA
jgi:hypothetical protein